MDLILSGGGLRGSFQAGLLSVLYKNNIKFDRIFGNSVGAINAVGYSTEQMDKMLQVWNEVIDGKKSFFTKGIFNIGYIFRGIFGGNGVFNNNTLQNLINQNYKNKLFKRGEVFVEVVDLLTGKLLHVTIRQPCHRCTIYDSKGVIQYICMFDDGEKTWLNSVLASTAIPIAFSPVKVNFYATNLSKNVSLQLVDGGVRNITPTSFPINMGSSKMVIILNNILEVAKCKNKEHIITIGSRCLEILTNEIYTRDIKIMEYINANLTRDKRKIDYILIKPNFSLSSTLDPTKEELRNLFNHGIKKGEELLIKLKTF